MSDWDSDAVPDAGLRGNGETVDDLYNSKGFFFRQRRGRLNLRKLEGIDMDRMIREVDVDTLQQHLEDLTFSLFNEDDLQFFSDRQVVKMFRLAQLTIEYLLYSQGQLVNNLGELSKKYSVKKKALHRKRRDLSSLKEEVDSLQSQLKAKRRNLSTLEKLVKDASKSRKPAQEDAKEAAEIVKFYVSLPNNIFMELEERPGTTIRNICSQAMNVILSDPNFEDTLLLPDDTQGKGHSQLKLFCRGRLLLGDSTLEQCRISSGDTLVASFATRPAPASRAPPKHAEVKQSPQHESNDNESKVMLQALGDLLTKQLKSMEQFAQEVSNCTSTLAASKQQDRAPVLDEAKLLGHMDDKFKSFEMEFKDNMAKVQMIQEQRRGLVFGELENDNEDLTGAIKDINNQLRQSFVKMDTITGQVQDTSSELGRIGDALRMHQDQLSDLRNSLQQRPAGLPQSAAPSSPKMSPLAIPVTLPKDSVTLKSNKWNMLAADNPDGMLNTRRPAAAAAAVTPRSSSSSSLQVLDFTPVVQKKVPAVVIRPEPKVEVKQEPAPVAPAVPAPAPAVPAQPTQMTVTFSMEQNPDLRSVNIVKVVVPLDSALPADEIIFLIRKTAATKVALPFSAVSLYFDKKVIKLGVDVPKSLAFAAEDVLSYAASGRLTLRLQKPKTLSDVQIDTLLVPAWQNDYSRRSVGSIDRVDDEDSKMDQVEPDSAAVKEQVDSFNTMRLSLDGMLRGLNDKDGLTDDEVAQKKSTLEGYSSASPSESEQFQKYRRSLVSAVGAAAASDSGAENARRHSNFLRSSGSFKSGGMSPSDSVSRSSADIGPLLRLRSSASSKGGHAKKSHKDGDSDAEDMSPHGLGQSIAMRRTWEQAAEESGRGFDYDDDLPMLSSLSQPLRALPPSNISGSQSSMSKGRYETEHSVEDPSPSFISSVGDDTMRTQSSFGHALGRDTETKPSSFPPMDRFRDNKHDERDLRESDSFQDSYSRSQALSATNMSTLTSALPDGFSLSQTIDSEGDILAHRGGRPTVDPHDIQRRADAYERAAAQELSAVDDFDEADGVSMIESPFKDYSRRGYHDGGGAGQLDEDTASVHSLALSDSHNTME